MPDDRSATARSNPYAHIEIEQARQARQAADALFKPKSPMPSAAAPPAQPDLTTPTILTSAPAPRVPRVLTVAAPAEIVPMLVPVPKPAAVLAVPAVEPRAEPIAASDHRRIRALAFYGQTIGQIARDYGVAEQIIAPIVMQSALAGANR